MVSLSSMRKVSTQHDFRMSISIFSLIQSCVFALRSGAFSKQEHSITKQQLMLICVILIHFSSTFDGIEAPQLKLNDEIFALWRDLLV